jgi:proline dehydrogenase
MVRRLASRYIAGETLEDACRVVAELNARGRRATIDVLGEELRDVEATHALTEEYRRVLAELDRRGLDANVSVKLSALGLVLDENLCRQHLRTLVDDARERGNFICIDMEDSRATEATLRLYRELREDGHENIGIVLQSYLRRTLADIQALADLKPDVRIVKGIYLEPAELAYQGTAEVRASFLRCLDALLETASRVDIATHDSFLIVESERRLAAAGWSRERYEYQMLLGVRPDAGEALVRAGNPLRIYVPYGRHWYAYSLRRLQENPRIAGYVTRDAIRRVVRQR